MKNLYNMLFHEMKWNIDLSLGSPYVFKEYLQNYMQDAPVSRQLKIHELMPYNKSGLLPELEGQIRKLHKKYHPNMIDDNSQIIVTNGATHAIMAFFHLVSLDKINNIFIPKPYWFRLPEMAKMQNSMTEHEKSSETALITIPNNPDGSIYCEDLSNFSNVWYDCVYNWPWYFKEGKNWPVTTLNNGQKPQAAIFSLSKFSGHCGTRIGWVIVNDNNLGKFLEHYVEYDTSGVSVEAQLRAASVMETFMSNNLDKKYQEILDERKKEFETVFKKIYEVTSKPLDSSDLSIDNGMFAWIKDKDEVLNKVGIIGMPGKKCGGEEGYLRINLCCSSESWNEAIFRLNNYIINICDLL